MKHRRILQIFTVSLCAILSLSIAPLASAATLIVNEYTDGAESGNTSGTCNLREAIQAINDGADIVGDCTATGTYGTADEIQFTGIFPQTYTLTWDAGGGVAHPLVLDKDVVITGPGSASFTIDGNTETQIFLLGTEFSGTGINLDLSGATLTNGDAISTFTNYAYHGGQGGAIHAQLGSGITLDDVIITTNIGGVGGGIFADNDATITISNSQIISNDATVARGGGMFVDEGSTFTITTTIIDGNRSLDDLGGGISSEADLTDIRLSTISNNTGNSTTFGFGEGGGIQVGDQGDGDAATNEFIFIDNVVSGNSTDGASDEGGGIYTQAGSSFIASNEISGNSASQGAGLKINRGKTVLLNNTISGNTSGGNGAAVKVGATAFVYFIHNTITENTTTGASRTGGIFFTNNGSADFRANIIAENNSPTAGYQDCHTFLANLSSSGYNLLGINNQCSGFLASSTGDNFGTSGSPETADLNALADNGGPSSPTLVPKTHEATALSTNVWEVIPEATCTDTFTAANYGSGGSVVDTTAHPFGTNILAEFAAITPKDQRGATRPGMTDCEVGAYENASLAVYDYGDAPDSYATLTASIGAFHTIDADLFMGVAVDDELDGQPTASADGDDNNGTTPDDEDGVTFSTLTESNSGSADIQIVNNTGGNAYLQAWVDYNSNGTFEAGEQVATDVAANASGIININISPPSGSAGTTYARFRLASTAGLGSSGDGGIGEVEDYQVTINNSASTVSSGGGGAGGRVSPPPPPSTPPQEPQEEDPEEILQAAIQAIAEAPTRQLIRLKDDLFHTKVWPRTGVDSTISSALARIYSATSPFPDLDINHRYFEPTVVLYLQGVVEGYTDGTVQLERHISRVEALKLILYTAESTIFDDTRALFPDTKEGAWYQAYLNTALYLNLISGYENGNFGPGDDITVGQSFKMLSQILNLPVNEETGDQQHWAEKYAHALRQKNIIPPELNNSALYDQHLTRGQLFALIYRAIMLTDHDHELFVDTIQVSIPKLNINNIPVQRTLLSTTAVWLKDIIDNAGFYENPVPEKKGQLVIFGHSSKYVWDPNTFGTIFRPLIDDLNVGDTVQVTILGVTQMYEITSREKVPEQNIDYLKNNASELILFTCDLDITQRWVFSAKKIK